VNKVILIQNGEALKSPAGFDPEPCKDEAAPLEGAASGTEHSSRESIDARILQETQRQRKAFVTMQAQFARVGYELKSKHHPAGITLFEVTRHGQTRIFSAWHDVGAFLAQVQGGVRHG
jgi:hypothetical protein